MGREDALMARKITKRQQQIYDFIKEYQQEKGYPPSVREMASAVGLSSPSTVHAHLSALEARGLLKRDATKPRALELFNEDGSEYKPQPKATAKAPTAKAQPKPQPKPQPEEDKPVPVATQKESKEEKERREARAILMERRDIEPGCPVPQRSPEIPPDKDY